MILKSVLHHDCPQSLRAQLPFPFALLLPQRETWILMGIALAKPHLLHCLSLPRAGAGFPGMPPMSLSEALCPEGPCLDV